MVEESTESPQWEYFTDAAIPSIAKDLFIDDAYMKVIQHFNGLYHAENQQLAILYYELLFSIAQGTRLSLKDAQPFLSGFFKRCTDNLLFEANKDIHVCFIQMINLFPTNDVVLTLIPSVANSTYKELYIKYLKTEILRKVPLMDSFAKKQSYYIKNQAKIKYHNLSYESSEGYAKLVAELHLACINPDSLIMVDYVNDVVLKIMGTYGLDPIRVLDIIFDVFIVDYVRSYQFCINFLKKSTWWPKANDQPETDYLEDLTTNGSQLAVQLLGFRVFNMDSDKNPRIRPQLSRFIALLIKEGFFSLGQFLEYLAPDDKEMVEFEKQYKESMNDKIFKASASALALAAPLKTEEGEEVKNDSKDGKDSDNAEKKDEKYYPFGSKLNMKYELLCDFLALGAYKESLFLLAKYPVLGQVDDKVSSLILKCFDAMINEFYFSSYHIVTDDKVKGSLTAKLKGKSLKTHNLVESYDIKRELREHFELKNYSGPNDTEFYHEWTDFLPKVDSIKDLFKYANEFLVYSGSKISNNGELITKLVRIGIKELEKNTDLNTENALSDDDYNEIIEKWFQFFRKFLFIAIPLIDKSPLVDIIFQLFKIFPVEKRYNLYGELEIKLKKRNLLINLEYDKATKQSKDGLKRLSKTNAHIIMRNLSKVSMANPLPFFQVITTQVESYDNLIALIVQSAKYFNQYAWDVLVYVLMIRLTSRRNFVQQDGLNDRLWLQNLASFIGKLCHSYSNSFNSKLLVEFLIRKLYEFDNMTIILFKEIIKNVSGIVNITNLTTSQIELMNSGESVAKSIYNVILDKRSNYFFEKASTRFLQYLVQDNNLDADLYNTKQEGVSKLSELFVLFTTYYRKQVFLQRAGENHSKILSVRNDELNSLLHTFITMVNYFKNKLSEDFFEENFLAASDLLFEHEVPVEWVFELWRPTFSEKICEEYASHPKSFAAKSPWPKTISPIINAIGKHQAVTHINFNDLSKGLYVSFWQLSLYDIDFDPENYNIKEKLELQLKNASQLMNSKDATREIKNQKLNEANELKSMLENLSKDEEKHKEHSELVKTRIEKEKKHWFNSIKDIMSQANEFIESCLLPRMIHSSFDAIFCAKFIIILLNDSDPTVKKISKEIVNNLFGNLIKITIFTSTPLESENFGLFFNCLMNYLNKLKDKKNFYLNEYGIEDIPEPFKIDQPEPIQEPQTIKVFDSQQTEKDSAHELGQGQIEDKKEDDNKEEFEVKEEESKDAAQDGKEILEQSKNSNDIKDSETSMEVDDVKSDTAAANETIGFDAKMTFETETTNMIAEKFAAPIEVGDYDILDEDEADKELKGYYEYTRQVYQWHSAIVSEISECLENEDYALRRNGITFLKNILGVCPLVDDHCEEILFHLDFIFNNDKREDIRLATNSLVNLLKSSKADWIEVYKFYKMDKEARKKYSRQLKDIKDTERRLKELIKKEEIIRKRDSRKLKEIDSQIKTAQQAEEKNKEEEVRKKKLEEEKDKKEVEEKERKTKEEEEKDKKEEEEKLEDGEKPKKDDSKKKAEKDDKFDDDQKEVGKSYNSKSNEEFNDKSLKSKIEVEKEKEKEESNVANPELTKDDVISHNESNIEQKSVLSKNSDSSKTSSNSSNNSKSSNKSRFADVMPNNPNNSLGKRISVVPQNKRSRDDNDNESDNKKRKLDLPKGPSASFHDRISPRDTKSAYYNNNTSQRAGYNNKYNNSNNNNGNYNKPFNDRNPSRPGRGGGIVGSSNRKDDNSRDYNNSRDQHHHNNRESTRGRKSGFYVPRGGRPGPKK